MNGMHRIISLKQNNLEKVYYWVRIIAKTDLTNQRQVFVEEYVRSGDHLEAAKKAGYKDTHTLRNQACKLRRECAEEITEELHRNFAEIAPRALNILTDLARECRMLKCTFRCYPRSFG